MYHLTTLRPRKLLQFHILGSCLVYTIGTFVVQALFTIGLLGETFPMIYQVTQTKINAKDMPQEVDVPSYNFGVYKTIHHIRRQDVGPLHYFYPHQDLSNGLSSDPNGNRMQKLSTHEFGMPTYHFEDHMQELCYQEFVCKLTTSTFKKLLVFNQLG